MLETVDAERVDLIPLHTHKNDRHALLLLRGPKVRSEQTQTLLTSNVHGSLPLRGSHSLTLFASCIASPFDWFFASAKPTFS